MIGSVPVPAALASPPLFFKQDLLSGCVYVTKTGEEEIPATAAQADKLEPAAVWGLQHVTDRLRDHFAGRPNVWLESMRVDRKKVPKN